MKLIAPALVGVLSLGLFACGNGKQSEQRFCAEVVTDFSRDVLRMPQLSPQQIQIVTKFCEERDS